MRRRGKGRPSRCLRDVMQYLLLIRLTARQTGSCVAAAARHSPDNIILEEATHARAKKKKELTTNQKSIETPSLMATIMPKPLITMPKRFQE